MTRRTLFKSLAGAFAGLLLARLPLAGKAVEVVDVAEMVDVEACDKS